jgi:serine kinase of HPr protein (carbohydrate metabolism regulator)
VTAPPTIHATAVAVRGAGVLLLGPPGSGKSDLALRLIDRGAVLIADDRVMATAKGDGLWLSAPLAIAGLIEVRGLGLLTLARTEAAAVLVVDLVSTPDRLPVRALREVAGVRLPVLAVRPFEASAPLKVELAVAHGLRED